MVFQAPSCRIPNISQLKMISQLPRSLFHFCPDYYILFFYLAHMEEVEKGSLKKDFVWKYAKVIPNEKYFRCKFCDQQCNGTVYRFKHHLAGTHKGMKPCPKVPEEVKEECLKALTNAQSQKEKRNELLSEIRGAADLSKSYGSLSPKGVGNGGSSTQASQLPKARGPMDKFTTSEARQATLDSTWKK